MRWLSIDPGETTGWALWDDTDLLEAGQTELKQFARDAHVHALGPLDRAHGPVELFVVERFALYPWVLKEGRLDFDEVRTARLIGALEYIADLESVDVVMQSATIKKPAMESGAQDLFQRPLHENRHANDAIMHGWFFVLTNFLGRRIQLPQASALLINPEDVYAPGE